MSLEVSRIKEQVSCSDFIQSLGIAVNSRGYCCCPLHSEKTPSLRIYPNNRGWYCFGCGKGGDVITLAQMYYGTDFKTTINQLCEDFNIPNSNAPVSASDRLRTAVERALNKSTVEAERAAKEAVEAQYWIAFDKWLSNKQKIETCNPTNKADSFSSEFIDAIKQREYLEMELDAAEIRRDHHAKRSY